MKKSMLGILATILLVSMLGGLILVNAQEEDSAVVAENLLDSLNASDTEVTNLFNTFVANNGTIPDDAAEALSEAKALYAEAQSAFDSGDYELAIEKAAEATNKYGEAAAKLVEVEDEDDEVEDESEDTYGKLGGYERALERLEKLREIASDLEGDGVDVSEANALLDSAETILDDIGAAIDQGNFEGLEDMPDEANSMLGEATGLLRSSGTPKRLEKTEHFIIQTRHHVNQLETKLNRIMAKYDITGEDSDAIREQFQALNGLLDDLSDDVDKDDLKSITRNIQHVVKESNKVGRGNDKLGEDLIEKVNDVSRKEAKLDSYRERLEALTQLGYNNTSDVEDLLDQAQGLLEQAQASLDEGDTETADDLIDEADDLLDEADDLLDDVGDKEKHGPRGEDEDETVDLERKKQELLKKINRFRQNIQARNRRGENTIDLETQLNELEQALDDAQTEEDFDSIEAQLDALESQIDEDSEDKSGKGDGGDSEKNKEPEEPEEPEGEEG